MKWAKASLGLAIFGFINLLLFIILSSPFNIVLNTLSDEAGNIAEYKWNESQGKSVPTGKSLNNSGMHHFYGMLRTVFGVTFLLSMFGVIIWFFLGTHEEEFEQM